jgi:ABC-type Fe3+/spermidine/putrescine transport system ATPase subunit
MFSGRVESVEGDRVTLRTSDDVRIKVVKQEEVEVGAEAYAAVRPEKVRFGSEGDNVISVEIRQVVYLGVSTQYIAERSGGGRIVLYQQNAHEAPGPAEGDEVSVTWDAGNCLILGG